MSNYNIPPNQYHRQQQPVTINPWTLSAASPNQDLALANKMQNLEERKKAAIEFIESVLGETLSVSSTGSSNSDGDKFWKALKDGVVLCRFMNKLQPDSIPKISLKPLPFTQMENISNFLQAAQKFGVETAHMFQTVDLYEAKDLSQVTITLLAIQRILKEGKPKPQPVQPNLHSHPPQGPANPSRTAKTPGAPSAHSTVLPNDAYSTHPHQMPSANQHSQAHHTQNQRPQSMVLPSQSSAASQRQNQQYRQSIAVAEEITKMSLSEPTATASHSNNLKLPTTSGNNAGSSDAQEKDKKSPASATGNTLVRMENGVEVATYLIGNCIGKGNFGTVYKAINIETNQTFAIKKIPLDARAKKEVEKLKKEVKVFQKLSHPNIVHYEGFVQTEDDFNIILEYVENGSLAHTLKNFGPLPEKMVVNNVIKICEGLGYLHEHGLMHLDLKAANILTTKNGEVKLSDFGVSLAINGSYTENERFVGTAYWMAPEIIELSGPTPASDIWSLGCTIIELVTGKPPYSELLTMAALFRIVEDDMPPIPEDLSKELKDFLMKCFNKDPSKRWSAKGLLEHEWLEPHVKRMKTSKTSSNNSLLTNTANSMMASNIYQPADEQQFIAGGMGMQVPQRTVAKGIPASLIEQQLAQKNSMFAGPSPQSNYMATPQNRQTMLMNFNQSPMALGNQQMMYNQANNFQMASQVPQMGMQTQQQQSYMYPNQMPTSSQFQQFPGQAQAGMAQMQGQGYTSNNNIPGSNRYSQSQYNANFVPKN